MSDDEETAGFGSDPEEDSDEETGFGDADEDEDDAGDEAGGFGADLDEDEDEDDEDAGGFGGDMDDEFGEDGEKTDGTAGADFGGAADDDDAAGAKAAAPAPPPPKADDDFEVWAPKYFARDRTKAKPYPTRNTWVSQNEPITLPLLAVKGPSEKTAVRMFVEICRWCGITTVVGKSTKTALQTAGAIIGACLRDKNLRDEAYCQVMKQMTQNPSKSSFARGVILLTLILGCYKPGTKTRPVVQLFIQQKCPPGFRSYMSLLLRRTIHQGTREQPPCTFEIEAAKMKQIMRVVVRVDLLTKQTNTARLDPASVNQEWVEEICFRHNIKNTYGWSIYIDRFGTLMSFRGAGGKGLRIMDVISKIDQKALKEGANPKSLNNIAGQLSFRKEFYEPGTDYTLDTEGTLVIYHQLMVQIMEGEFFAKKDDDWNYLAAVIYYHDNGDDTDEKKMLAYIQKVLPPIAFETTSAKDRVKPTLRHTAKGIFTREGYNDTQVEAELIRFMLEKWGRVNSFSADGNMMLVTNGKKRRSTTTFAGKRGTAKGGGGAAAKKKK